MVSRENKRTTLHEKLQLLRSITNSHAYSVLKIYELSPIPVDGEQAPGQKLPVVNKTSIIVDASKYIQELKQKVERLNQDIEAAQISTNANKLPMQVKVESLENGFMINVFSDTSCPGLLVSILEAFEELGLNVLEARVSCTDSFHLQAVGGETIERNEGIDARVVKQAVLHAIDKWIESSEQK